MEVNDSFSSTLSTKILLTMNRWILVGVILSIVFTILVSLSYLESSPLRSIVENQGGLHFIFSAFIGAIITGTSIVVTINQLVLSQELGAVGKQQSRMQNSMDFRQEVEKYLDKKISSPEPSAFILELVQEIEEQAKILNSTTNQESTKLKNEIEDYTTSLIENAQLVNRKLEGSQFGTFQVIWAALNFNYSEKINQLRQIQADYNTELSKDKNETIDQLLDLLTFFGPTREHFKTLYFQWELIKLSRTLMYASVLSLMVIGALLIHINTNVITGTTLGLDNLVLLTSAGFTIGIAPFVIFIAFLLRISTVAKRTLAMGPFILKDN